MKPVQGWLLWQGLFENYRQKLGKLTMRGKVALLGYALTFFLAGCGTTRANVEKNLMAENHLASRHQGVMENYLVAWPDVLEVTVPGTMQSAAVCPISLDGRIDLGFLGQLRVEGRTPPEIAQLLAEQMGVSADKIKVGVREYKSQHVFLFGQVAGWQRAVPYQGQETVLDLLQRVGGLTPGAAPECVYVARAHINDGQRPEVYHVDLEAIIMKNDPTTNIRLLPYDQVYVGETRQCCLEKCLPPWLRHLLRSFSGTNAPPGQRPEDQALR